MSIAPRFMVAFHILLISGKINFFHPLLLRATSGCSDIGTESKGNYSRALAHWNMSGAFASSLYVLFHFNKSIFTKLSRHESIQENPIGICVPCVYAWISNIVFFLHFLGFVRNTMSSGHGCFSYLLENSRKYWRYCLLNYALDIHANNITIC